VWNSGAGWNDGTSKEWPDWLSATWSAPQQVGHVRVLTIDQRDQPASQPGLPGYDGRGRPSLTGPGQRSPQLRLSVPAELQQRLKTRAEQEHTSISQLAREALERYLAS